MEISICIITKNEAHKLERCLKALQPYNFEIVVVDTGSTDNTKEMALQYTNSLYDFPWCDDFAAAKNYAVQKAKNDTVLVIDSDEYLQELNLNELWKMVKSHPNDVGRIQRINILNRNGETNRMKEWVNRIFNRRLFHYSRRIHEQLVPGSVFEQDSEQNTSQELENKIVYSTYLTNIKLEHDGYNGSEEERRKKAQRNIILLKKELDLNPEDTYILYQLGKGYYMAGEYPQAVSYFDIALGYDVNPKLEYVIDMVETYGYALLNSQQPQKALMLEGIYEEFGNTADFQFLMGLIYMNNGLFEQAIEEFLKAAKQPDAKAEGVNSYLSFYNAGVIKECMGDVKGAMRLYSQCGDYKKALERLEQIK